MSAEDEPHAGRIEAASIGEQSEEEEPRFLSREWIDRHNAEVRAVRGRYEPLIAAITDEQARTAVELGSVTHMEALAVAMRAHLDWEIPDSVIPWIGIEIYVTALERLGLYDDDFRPRPPTDPR